MIVRNLTWTGHYNDDSNQSSALTTIFFLCPAMKISLLTAPAQSGSLQLSVSRNLNSLSNGQNENLICQENIQFLLRNA